MTWIQRLKNENTVQNCCGAVHPSSSSSCCCCALSSSSSLSRSESISLRSSSSLTQHADLLLRPIMQNTSTYRYVRSRIRDDEWVLCGGEDGGAETEGAMVSQQEAPEFVVSPLELSHPSALLSVLLGVKRASANVKVLVLAPCFFFDVIFFFLIDCDADLLATAASSFSSSIWAFNSWILFCRLFSLFSVWVLRYTTTHKKRPY